MDNTAYPDDWYDIDKTLYNRSVRVFDTVKKVLSVKLKLHAESQINQGDIFLFNHFSRFETFIPQFLIFEQTGAFSCAIASGEFFQQDNVLARFLSHVGVFPHDHQRLFALLTSQILRGRKVIIFPEGSMIKDHKVIDEEGNYGIFSRTTGLRRKPHTGAAVLAQGVEAIKTLIRRAYHDKNHDLLVHWKEQLMMDSLDQLIVAALKDTWIVPANITFYPLRTSENLLLNAVDFFSENLSLRQTEELLVEGNILFKHTDMDIRLGVPLKPLDKSLVDCQRCLNSVLDGITSIDEIFNLQNSPKNWRRVLLAYYFKKYANATRDRYMEEIYQNVTINLSHLASTLIMYLAKQGGTEIDKQKFYLSLYIAVKELQNNANVNLHRSLLNPMDYADLTNGHNNRFTSFIDEAINTELLAETDLHYKLLPKLLVEQNFDSIRLNNIIAVYDNEAKPIKIIKVTVIQALAETNSLDEQQISAWRIDDEHRDLSWEHHAYNKAIYANINNKETATEDPSPFFLEPNQSNGIGILLVHGLLASPAEVRSYGEYLMHQGFTVMGVRLKGHGTSPYALQEQNWQDWYGSVLRGYQILKAHHQRIFVIGFSSGGALALKLASENYPELLGVVAISVPVKFVDPAFMFVPLLHGTNKLIDSISMFEGIKPFMENKSEHPKINYKNVPVKSLYELRLLIEEMEEFLPKCQVPVLLLQGDNDPVVSVKSVYEVMSMLTCKIKQLDIIPSHKHGILMESIGETWQKIDQFLKQITNETNTH